MWSGEFRGQIFDNSLSLYSCSRAKHRNHAFQNTDVVTSAYMEAKASKEEVEKRSDIKSHVFRYCFVLRDA